MSKLEPGRAPSKCVVAFLDILGFKNAVKAIKSPRSEVFQRLLPVLEELREQKRPTSLDRIVKDQETEGSIRLTAPSVTGLSDAVVVSCSMDNHEAAWHVARKASDLARSLLEQGFASRGAIVLGWHYHSQDIVIGPAMVEAYLLEGDCAVYPRVILSRAAARLLRRSVFAAGIPLAKSADGFEYLDIFRAAAAEGRAALGRLEAGIESGRRQCKTNERHLAKWTWLQTRCKNALQADV